MRLFNVGDDEHVVGAAKIDEADEEGDEYTEVGTAPPTDLQAN